jgi:hypothetical protein
MSSDTDKEKQIILKRLWSLWVLSRHYMGRHISESFDMDQCTEFMAVAVPFADALIKSEAA